jgi:hypothetical protein
VGRSTGQPIEPVFTSMVRASLPSEISQARLDR